jgi:hypothetical protein
MEYGLDQNINCIMSKNTIVYGDVYSGINSLEDGSISVIIITALLEAEDYGFEGQIVRKRHQRSI